MLNKYARAFFTRVLTPFAAFLLRRGVSPDAVTLLGTAGVMAGALVFYPRGEFFWGTVVITLFVFSDLVDGNMARQLGRSSRWGAFLDSTLDRVADARSSAASRSGTRAAATTTSCARSRSSAWPAARWSRTPRRAARAIGLPVAVNGLVERAERLVISLVAAGSRGPARRSACPASSILLPIALWIVAVGSLVTLIQRVVTVRRESAEAEAAADGRPGQRDASQEQ